MASASITRPVAIDKVHDKRLASAARHTLCLAVK